MIAVEDLGDGIEVAGEVALCALGYATTAPGDEDMLGQTSVGVPDLDEAKLDAALAEVFEEFAELALCKFVVSMRRCRVRVRRTFGGLLPYRQCSLP